MPSPTDAAWTEQAAATGTQSGRQHGSDINLQAGAQLAEYEAAADRIAAAKPVHVLDWGCGYGYMTRLLTDRGLTVTSIDYNPSLSEPETRPLDRFPGLEAIQTPEPVTLPFADASFDAVLSMGVLEHVGDPEGSLDELHRVLQPGGIVYCHKLPNRASWLEAIARKSGRMYYHGQLENDTLYTLPSARRIFTEHGFQPMWARYANMLPLTVTTLNAVAPLVWAVNRLLARVPLLNRLATNVELAARRA